MRRFAHLSDPHLSSLEGVSPRSLRPKQWLGYLSWRRRRRQEHRRELLDVLTADLCAQPLAQIVLTGDLTHIGLESEFAQTRSWLQDLAPPPQLTLVPGNHDATLPASIALQRRYWSEYLSGEHTAAGDAGAEAATAVQAAAERAPFPTLRVVEGIAFIGVDSAIASAPLLAVGEVGAAQRARLARLLDECAAQGLFRVLCLHHCPLPGADRARKRLRDAAAVRDILVEHGVELILHGHNHRSHIRTLPTRVGEAPVLCAPSASARGLHGHTPGGYHMLELSACPGGWQLHWQRRSLSGGTQMVPDEQRPFTLLREHAPPPPH